jgi:hypothetical protein
MAVNTFFIAKLVNDFYVLQKDVSAIKTQTAVTNSELSGIKQEVADIKEDIKYDKTRINFLEFKTSKPSFNSQ